MYLSWWLTLKMQWYLVTPNSIKPQTLNLPDSPLGFKVLRNIYTQRQDIESSYNKGIYFIQHDHQLYYACVYYNIYLSVLMYCGSLTIAITTSCAGTEILKLQYNQSYPFATLFHKYIHFLKKYALNLPSLYRAGHVILLWNCLPGVYLGFRDRGGM